MLFSEYLGEKAEESRHNEIIGYFLIVVGSIFYVGGLLVTAIKVQDPEWFLIVPYQTSAHAPDPYSLMGLTLTTVGIVLFVLGLALSIHYARQRTWYMKELHKAHSLEEQKLKEKRG